MKPIPETRTELIDLFTSEKKICINCNQNQIFKKRSEIHCPLIPRHSGHVVLECSGCEKMTTIDRVCDGFGDLRDLMKINEYEISKDEDSISEYSEWLSSYCKPYLENELVYPSTFNWEEFWKEIQTHTDSRKIIGFKKNVFYSFDPEAQTVSTSHPKDGVFKISLNDFKNTLAKMEQNKIENKDIFDEFSNFETYSYAVWRIACRGKDFWEKTDV